MRTGCRYSRASLNDFVRVSLRAQGESYMKPNDPCPHVSWRIQTCCKVFSWLIRGHNSNIQVAWIQTSSSSIQAVRKTPKRRRSGEPFDRKLPKIIPTHQAASPKDRNQGGIESYCPTKLSLTSRSPTALGATLRRPLPHPTK